MKRILITGGAGFIGSHLCDFYLSKGFAVICLDNLLTGSVKNIRHNFKNKRFTFIKHDISRPIRIKGKIDYLLHFASPASPKDYDEFPIETLKAGSLGTHNALGIALVKRAVFLLASTSEIYGDPQVSPQREDYWGNVNSIGARSCYDEAKRFSEAITMAYHRKKGLDIRIIRIFNTYGPRMRKNDGRVVPNFITDALKGKPLTVYGDGMQTRSFCYISDLIDGIYKVISCNQFSSDQLGRIFNIGNPEEITIIKLVDIFRKLFNYHIKIKKMPLPQDDPKQRKPDISKAKRKLKWRPKTNIELGLRNTIGSWNG